MDLKVCLKYIIGFCLCIWQSEIADSMKCEIGNFLQDPQVDHQCSSSLDFNEYIRENCQFFVCKQNETVNWKLVDSKIGKLVVYLPVLPVSCNFDWYDVDLEVYDENLPFDEGYVCSTGNLPWRTHSKRVIENSICSNCSLQSSKNCLQVHVLNFKYVYSGFYRLKVTPYVNGSTRQAQRSYRIHVNHTLTNYKKKKFSDLNLNASLQYRDVKRELDLGIPLLIDHPPEEVKIDVKFSSSYIHLYGIKYGNENSSSIRCDEKENLPSPFCQVQKAELECKFFNMSHGLYGVQVRFIDDRCKQGTVWANHDLDPCYWVIKKNFSTDGAISDTLIPSNEPTSPEILCTIIVVVILIGIIVISFVAKKFKWKRHRLEKGFIGKSTENGRKTNTERTYNFNNSQVSKFNFGQLLTLSERPRPEVLLVYTRETPPFMELVVCLRRVLDKICKCQVYDYFDPELWNEVSEDPKGWVHALIVERQAKVIIIASEVAAIRNQSLMGEFPKLSYKCPHPFDHLFLYALRLLRDGLDEESYKNHFVVTFDGFTESNHLLEYFNPYTRFILPKHLNKLFEHLHDTDTTIHFDTNRLEERFEVRQLRLQLEHLKNLKLLAKSDLDTCKLYDW